MPTSLGATLPQRIARACAQCALVLLVSACSTAGSHRRAEEERPPARETVLPIEVVESVPTSASPLTVPPQPTLSDEPTARGTFVSRELISTQRISQGTDGEPSDGPASAVAMSADGRNFAFVSSAGNLAPGDANGFDDVYLYDANAGITERLSSDASGAAADGWSSGPAVSADGHTVAFYSWAGDLTPNDSNAVQDLFVYDRIGGDVERISRAADGSQANDRSGDSRAGAHPALSADGSVIAYHSQASNLVDIDTNGRQDVFVYDAGAQRTTRVSVSSMGMEADGDSRDPALSADGRLVAFSSRARNLDADAPNPEGISQVYIHDRTTRRTRMVSLSPNDAAGNADSFSPALSGDGYTLVFASVASDLVADDENDAADIFLVNLDGGSIERISVSSAGTGGIGDSTDPAISLEGRYVAYVSTANNLVSGDSNGAADIFLYDRLTRHTARASVGVQGPWTGVQANGDSFGPPAVAASGRLIAFVSEATNLVTEPTPTYAEIYALERTDLPAYAVRGRVVDDKNRPVADVTVAAGPHQAVTGADGRYALANVPGGTYTLEASRENLSFVPARRTVSVVANTADVNFRAMPNGGDRLSFLSLPFGGNVAASDFLQALRDSDEGGWVDAWFDHDAPDKSKNEVLQLWDGRDRHTGFFNAALGCYEGRCYDGHDGTDFPYRDPNPATAVYEPLLVHAAAEGLVARTYDLCESGDRWCNGGYGNEVILLHDNGYFTRYAHLASVGSAAQTLGARIEAGDALGVLGSTGNSYGAHLHFAVHQDDGDGRWDGETQDVPVDPFGWSGADADPWATAVGGATSRWMWNEHPTVERMLFGDLGGEIRDQTSAITVRVPPGALAGQARLSLEPGAAAAAPAEAARSVGRSFSLSLLDWYPASGQAVAVDELQGAALALPFEISVTVEDADTRHLDATRAVIARWDEEASRWQPLPTLVEQNGAVVSAASDRFGRFDAQAPLLCPAEPFEPDDDYYAATYVEPGDVALRRVFDTDSDEDWVRFQASSGQSVSVRVDDIAEGVVLSVEIYGVDGLSRFSAAESTDGLPVQLAWSAPSEGDYFVRVAPAPGSRTGCDAAYSLTLD